LFFWNERRLEHGSMIDGRGITGVRRDKELGPQRQKGKKEHKGGIIFYSYVRKE
jgi:hypothetical protein